MGVADALRQELGRTLRFDAERGVFVHEGSAPLLYTDGMAAEDHVAAAIRAASDIAVGSTELASHIRDWPSLYHLSPARQNLLRPVARALRGTVLEIGAGCGAITRQLGESADAVLAVEGTLERASIAASRCRDLGNVVVACANFADLALERRFDLVTLIGVLEYSPVFLAGDDPVQAMLERCAGLLAEGGVLAIAIENQLGLKYLAGAREDHSGLPYYGVTDRYGPRTAVTFGEAELRERMRAAGYGLVEFLYPFPDYKLPAAVVTERGFREPRFNVADLVATTSGRHHPHEGVLAFSESLARDVFVRNGLGPATANSFLVVAGKSDSARKLLPDASALAFAYSTHRHRAYAKATAYTAAPGEIAVTRTKLFDAAPPADAPVRQRLDAEPYLRGEVMFRALERLLVTPGWSLGDLVVWAKPLVELLQAGAAQGAVAPAYYDCTPFNVIRRAADGVLVPFDLEWERTGAPPMLEEVLFRGLWNSLARVDDVVPPAAGTPLDILSLAIDTLRSLGFPVQDEKVLEWVRADYAFSNAVAGKSEPAPSIVPALSVGGTGGEGPALPSDTSGRAAPRANLRVEVFPATAERGFSPETIVAVSVPAHDDPIVARVPLAPHAGGYTGLRVDPMDQSGLIRLNRVAVVDANGRTLWETRRCAPVDFARVRNFRALRRMLGSRTGSVWFAYGDDPSFDLPLTAEGFAALAGGGAVVVEMRRLEVSDLSALMKLAEIGGGMRRLWPW